MYKSSRLPPRCRGADAPGPRDGKWGGSGMGAARGGRRDPACPSGARSRRAARGGARGYLTPCIYQLVLESQLPHKIVNLLFTITN